LFKRSQTLPDLPECAFDIAVGLDAFYEVSDKRKLLRNISKCLKKDGKLVMMETTEPNSTNGLTITPEMLNSAGFTEVSIVKISEEVEKCLEESIALADQSIVEDEDRNLRQELLEKWKVWATEKRKWYLIRATVVKP